MNRTFGAEVVAAIARHMNTDHADDCVLICRALGGQPETRRATMRGYDGAGIDFVAETPHGTVGVRVPWSAPVTERTQVRVEVVRMYEQACAALGVDPRPH